MDGVALFGAAGAIGGSIAAELRKKNQPYRVVGRGRTELERAFGSDPNAEIVTWNPDDPASVRAAARGVGTIFYLVGVPYWQFELHPRLMRKTLEGAIAESVRRIVLVGTVYPSAAREPSGSAKIIRASRTRSKAACAKSRRIWCWTPTPPARFTGPSCGCLISMGRVSRRAFWQCVPGRDKRRARAVGWPHQSRTNSVRCSVGNGLALAMNRGPTAAPGISPGQRAQSRNAHLSSRYFAKLAASLSSSSRTRPCCANYRGLFSPMMREMVEMNYLFETPVIMDDSAIHALLGEIRKTLYEEGIRETLRLMRAVQHH